MKVSFLLERILITILSIISIVQCTSYDFLFNNTCGCFLEQHLCYEKAELVPQPRDLVFDAFPLVNDCSKLFLDGYNISKSDETNGNIRLSLLLNPLKSVKELVFRMDLMVAVENSTNMVLQERRSYNIPFSSESVVQVDFSYLYSGTYQLQFFNSNCHTRNFSISSSYHKEKLNELEPYFHNTFTSESQIIASFSQGGLNLTEKVQIILYAEACPPHSSRVLETVIYRIHGANGTCCSNLRMDGMEEENEEITEKSSTCPCFWDGSKLKCLFYNKSESLYCAVINFIDRRCSEGTIWTNENMYCSWFYNITASKTDNSPVFKMISTQSHKFHYWFYSLLILGMLTVVCGTVCLLIKMSFKKFNERKQNSEPIRRPFIEAIVKFCTILFISRPKLFEDLNNARKRCGFLNSSNESNSLDTGKLVVPEILLLYPRDCEAFMRTMIVFRKNLENNDFLVHDPWDEENYEHVVESFEKWILSLLKKHDIKIIIILNECSKAFERAFLDNSLLEYDEPKALDSIFRLSLSYIHHYFAERFDSYQRLFVVRFGESACVNFNFITPATVYSLPLNIEVLIEDLRGYPGNLNSELLMELKTSTSEYDYFRRANSDYLNDLLKSKTKN